MLTFFIAFESGYFDDDGEFFESQSKWKARVRRFYVYLTIVTRMLVGYNHVIINKREWNNLII